jgi:hypothetical protein
MGEVSGALIAESLLIDRVLEAVPLVISKIYRVNAGDTSIGQPLTWTFLHFRVPGEHSERWAESLRDTLEPSLGWYCDFRSADETFVVFAGRIFRYPRGNRMRRREVEDYARTVGVPEGPLDWPE